MLRGRHALARLKHVLEIDVPVLQGLTTPLKVDVRQRSCGTVLLSLHVVLLEKGRCSCDLRIKKRAPHVVIATIYTLIRLLLAHVVVDAA